MVPYKESASEEVEDESLDGMDNEDFIGWNEEYKEDDDGDDNDDNDDEEDYDSSVNLNDARKGPKTKEKQRPDGQSLKYYARNKFDMSVWDQIESRFG